VAAPTSFRPDNPSNALIYVWPGVPIAAFAIGLALSALQFVQRPTLEFGVLAALMAAGLAIECGVLVRAWCFRWLIVTVDGQGLRLSAVARERIGLGEVVTLPWAEVESAQEVTHAPGGPALTISAGWRTYRIPRLLYRAETYAALAEALRSHLQHGTSSLGDAQRAA
jgi:hypothetical protein